MRGCGPAAPQQPVEEVLVELPATMCIGVRRTGAAGCLNAQVAHLPSQLASPPQISQSEWPLPQLTEQHRH